MSSTDSPLVMIWRRVSNLQSAKALAESMLNLSAIGQDEDTVMYDAGSVIVGLWGQKEFRRNQTENAAKLIGADEVAIFNAARLQATNQCSALNFSKVDLVANPATDIMFATEDLDTPRARLRDEGVDMRSATVKSVFGDTLPFFDDDGNLFSVAHISPHAISSATGFVGLKLGGMMQRRLPDTSHMTAVNLMASDLAKSQAFYSEVLGYTRLDGMEGLVTFDLGTSILNLRPESVPRVVKSLCKAGRLNADWFVFHTKDIAKKVRNLERRGVIFPQGIETSAIGHMAYFNDPDGYSLVIWQPPESEVMPMKKINFFPALNRILGEAR